jgi:hypothetical protein
MIRLSFLKQKLSNLELIRFTHIIITSMVNPLFNHPVVQKLLASIKESLAKLEATANATSYHSQSLEISAIRTPLEKDMALLIDQVELLINDADLTDEERALLAVEAGFTLRQHGKRTKQKFEVTNGKAAGEIMVVMEGRKKAYEVMYTDDLVNYSNKQTVVSAVSVATISGLKSSTKYAVFYRAHGPKAENVMYGPLFVSVH